MFRIAIALQESKQYVQKWTQLHIFTQFIYCFDDLFAFCSIPIKPSLKNKHLEQIKTDCQSYYQRKNSIVIYLFQGIHFWIACTLIQLSKQNQQIVLIMQQTLQYLNAISQDVSLRSQNCCHVLIERQGTPSVQPDNKSLIKMRDPKNKEKGIRLTHTKSSNVIRSNKGITQNHKITTVDSSQKKLPKMINTIKSANYEDYVQINHKRNTKKCIDYKNRRIAERSNIQLECVNNCGFLLTQLKKSKKSIEKYTPRTTIKTQEQGLELSELADKNFQLSWILSPQKQKNEGDALPGKRFFKPTKSKKTLQRLYEQQLGRRVVTVQSQDEDNDSDQISIIEPFQWRLSLA